jgi:GNAT superfamily N-acetyltransferase
MDPARVAWTRVNYFEGWRLIVEGSDQSEVLEFDGLLVTNCGLAVPFFNVAFVQRPLRSPEESIDRVLRYFEERGLPFLICIPPKLDPDTEALIAGRHFRLADPHPGMTLSPIPSLPESPQELDIRAVMTDSELEDFQTTAELGFGMPPSLTQQLASQRFRDHPAVSMFVGYVEGRPASTSCLIRTGGVAGVYWVSTREEFRGRGFGAAISAHAVRVGQSFGCDVATLQASPMGRPIYERMGFEVTDDYRNYEVPARA